MILVGGLSRFRSPIRGYQAERLGGVMSRAGAGDKSDAMLSSRGLEDQVTWM